jgi:hypothetical protein
MVDRTDHVFQRRTQTTLIAPGAMAVVVAKNEVEQAH